MTAAVSAPETRPAATPVPPLNLVANFNALRDELLAELTAVATSGYYVLGPKVLAFEKALTEYCGSKYAVAVSSGTDAQLMAMMALNIGPGDEVIVPTFTFFATAGTVARLGAKPVFCDIEPATFNIDVNKLEKLITPKTKAIVPVHLYGQLADIDACIKIGAKHGIPVIEDAAQAIGARFGPLGGPSAGAFGAMGCLSFYPTKNLGAMGDAGAFLTNDEKLYELGKSLRVHGSGHTYYHSRVGGNFRIDALQAAILTIKLRMLETWTEQRRARAAQYEKLIGAAALPSGEVRTPPATNGRHVYHQYVLRVNAQRRDDLLKHLQSKQIGAGVYYPLPLHMQECFKSLGCKAGDLPVAEQAAREVLALPIYPELTDRQQQTVVDAIAEFFRAPR